MEREGFDKKVKSSKSSRDLDLLMNWISNSGNKIRISVFLDNLFVGIQTWSEIYSNLNGQSSLLIKTCTRNLACLFEQNDLQVNL